MTLFISTYSQSDEWVWMKGDKYGRTTAYYGTKGIPGSLNHPGPRYEPCEWTDLEGNFWLFGGKGVDVNWEIGHLNDLWKFNPATKQWTWMSGSKTRNDVGDYGTMGVSSLRNSPQKRAYASLSWVDKKGNLWLYGGISGGDLDDLWKYGLDASRPDYLQWTWINGNKNPRRPMILGTKGVFDPANSPGGKSETSCSWVDNSGYFWFFGGRFGGNYMWRYDPDPSRTSYNQWACMNGDGVGVYGSKGIPDPLNQPSAREAFSSWKDKDGYLWFFGGALPPGNYCYNDLWKYDPNPSRSTYNQWEWVGGDSTINSKGVYGEKCVANSTNMPGARNESRARWTDDCGNFWLFGGEDPDGPGLLNDLWKYNPASNQWVWVSGDNVKNNRGVNGTIEIPDRANKPAARDGAVAWRNSDGLWLFGGVPDGGYNDLWKYIPEKPKADFIFESLDSCGKVGFKNKSVSNCNEIKSYLWIFGDPASGKLNLSFDIDPLHQYNKNGTYPVRLVVTSCTGGKDSISKNIIISSLTSSVNAGANVSIEYGTSISLLASLGTSYSWFPSEGLSCTDCQSPVAIPLKTTKYFVTISDSKGCIGLDSIIVTVTDTHETFFLPNSFTPNDDGNNDVYYIYGNNIEFAAMKIYNRWGELIFESSDIKKGWDGRKSFGFLNGILSDKNSNIVPEDVYICIANVHWKSGKEQIIRSRVSVIK